MCVLLSTSCTSEVLEDDPKLVRATEALADFFRIAESVHEDLLEVESDLLGDLEAGVLEAETSENALALSAVPLTALVPAGMDEDLETAVLTVYSDIESRIASVSGAVRRGRESAESSVGLGQESWDCLNLVVEPAGRFETDLAVARRLAESASVSLVAPDSVEAGILAVRIMVVSLSNRGCDACGGVRYDSAIPVDWENRMVADSLEFEAEFVGDVWVITSGAC